MKGLALAAAARIFKAMEANEMRITVSRQARFFTLGGNGGRAAVFWIVLHGYGQLAEFFMEKFKPVATDSRRIIAPEGLSRFYTQGFSGRVGASWMTREMRSEEIEDYLAYLDRVYDEIPPEAQVYLLGFSQGAATAARWFYSGRRKLKGLVLWCGVFPPDLPEPQEPQTSDLPLMVVRATDDPFDSPEVEAEMKRNLQKVKSSPRVYTFSGGHEVLDKPLVEVVQEMENKGL